MGSEAEQEGRKPNVIKEPKRPSQKEIDEHNVNHIPFRSWCKCCVMGAAPNISHKKPGDNAYTIPHVSCDYCFMGDKADEETLVIQVAKYMESKSVFAHAAPRKGLSHEHGAQHMCSDLEYLGYTDIVLKTDNEPAMGLYKKS